MDREELMRKLKVALKQKLKIVYGYQQIKAAKGRARAVLMSRVIANDRRIAGVIARMLEDDRRGAVVSWVEAKKKFLESINTYRGYFNFGDYPAFGADSYKILMHPKENVCYRVDYGSSTANDDDLYKAARKIFK